MGWQDRDYASEEAYGRTMGRKYALIPKNLSLSSLLIIINVVVFFLDSITTTPKHAPLFEWGSMWTPGVLHGQVWRLITSQYLHANTAHIFFNMLALHFLGRYLEQFWGKWKFFVFYTTCGLAGNIFYLLMNLIGWLPSRPAIGASGCLLGVLGACAVLFPGIRLIVFIFPMQIRTAAGLFLVYYVMNLLSRGWNAGGDAAHLAGLLVGCGYAFWSRRSHTIWNDGVRRIKVKVLHSPATPSASPHEKNAFDQDVDQILNKIKEHGVAGLTEEEKAILAEASRRRQDENGNELS